MKTPFLEYQLLELSSTPIARSTRGYDASIGVWERLDEIREIADRVRIRDRRVRKDILAVGPCPGLWRTYYAAMIRVQKDEIVPATEYLGNQLTHGISRRELGIKFDDWVAEANRHYNAFLETQNLVCLEGIKGIIGEYYRARANAHCKIAPNFNDRLKTKLQIKPAIPALRDLPIDELKPDGIFSEGTRAAVFEAKLSFPGYREFIYEMTVYAVTYERMHKKDADYAVVLYSDYPDGRQLSTLKRPIFDSYVNEIASNIERFLRLAQLSEALARGRVTARIRAKIKLGYGSWKRFLQRPLGLPNQNEREPCPSCKYRFDCYREGGES